MLGSRPAAGAGLGGGSGESKAKQCFQTTHAYHLPLTSTPCWAAGLLQGLAWVGATVNHLADFAIAAAEVIEGKEGQGLSRLRGQWAGQLAAPVL